MRTQIVVYVDGNAKTLRDLIYDGDDLRRVFGIGPYADLYFDSGETELPMYVSRGYLLTPRAGDHFFTEAS